MKAKIKKLQENLDLLNEKQSEHAAYEAKITHLQQLLSANQNNNETALLEKEIAEAKAKYERLQRELSASSNRGYVAEGDKGWVISKHLNCPGSPIDIGMICQTVPSLLNLRSMPLLGNNRVGIIIRGQHVKIITQPQDVWVGIEVTGATKPEPSNLSIVD